ncbi:hypothetical protein BGX38DRAFT_481947 [Terfezia claveryi]|nr:hypothetical protein BGX38DRAFT_481947 [Terfezia claveryi]
MNVPKIRTDPRIRQNLNHLQNTLESATDSARAGCFAFTKNYLEPLYDSLFSCYTSCCTTCCSYIPDSDSHSYHHNQQRNNNSEFPFDFYNDDYWYDYDDGGRGPSGGFLAWGNDELDRLLAGSSGGGSGGHTASPEMYYGSHNNTSHHSDIRSGALGLIGGRRKRHTGAGGGSGLQHADGRGASDPTVIPSTSAFGFLGRFPWWGRVERRYRPSAADLQEHPGMPRDFPHHDDDHDDEEAQGLLSEGPSNHNINSRAYTQFTSPNNRGRKRSHTSSSGTSGESFRSRGDLFPSDGEDDAVPLGDEFSIVLRSGGSGASDIDGEMSMRGLRRGSVLSGMSSAPPSSRRRSTMGGDVGYQGDDSGAEVEDDDDGQRTPRGRKGPRELDEEALRTQEAALAEAEEREIERKRAQAKRLARERGFTQESPITQPRSRSSPHAHSTHVSYSQNSTIGMDMLSPMSLPTNSPRMLPHSTPIHPISPRIGNPRSPGVMQSPVLTGVKIPAQIFFMPNHVAAAAATALRRPMSPISPLGGSPVRGSPLGGLSRCVSECGEEVEIVMSPEEISRSVSRGGSRDGSEGDRVCGARVELDTDVQTQVLARREVVEPFVNPPPVPSVERVPEEEEEEEEGHSHEGRMVEGGMDR